MGKGGGGVGAFFNCEGKWGKGGWGLRKLPLWVVRERMERDKSAS